MESRYPDLGRPLDAALLSTVLVLKRASVKRLTHAN